MTCVLYDISVLGTARRWPLMKTGVYRVVERLARSLAREDLYLRFCAGFGNVTDCHAYLMGEEHLSPVHLSRSSNFLPRLIDRMETAKIRLSRLRSPVYSSLLSNPNTGS